MLIKTMLIFFILSIAACDQQPHTVSEKSSQTMQKEVKQMMDSVSKDIYTIGPAKWLCYFENTSSFYMASEGRLVFPDYNAAKVFINDTLVHAITKVNLQWKNINIDSISRNAVTINSAYHEDLTAANGNILHEDGYCTAIAYNTTAGWKFRSLHWSVRNNLYNK